VQGTGHRVPARAYCSGAGAASQDRRLFGAFVPVSYTERHK
jgi:hypothetical protein